MSFRKVTISIPENMYKEGMILVKKGLFSNFSDLVRSGIREEFKDLEPVVSDIDERSIYEDKKLIEGIQKSVQEINNGKFTVVNTESEMDQFFNSI